MSVTVSQAVWEHGPEKAADRMMLLAIADHADDNGHAWPSIERLAAKCCVKPRAATYTISRLDQSGWITRTIGGGTIDGVRGRTTRYQIVLSRLRPTLQPDDSYPATHDRPTLQPVAGEPSVEPPVEPKTPAADATGDPGTGVASEDRPTATAAEREHMTTTADRQPTAADEPLLGMPAPEPKPPEPSAGELVAGWCKGWSEAHGGQQPHGSVVRRVAGVCKNVARDCATMDDWRDAYRAAYAAGAVGRYDVVAHLAAPVPQGRQNHYLALARNPEQLRTGGLLGTMLGQSQGPRAIGGAS